MTNYFVSVDGNDGNVGDFDHPFRTIGRAVGATVIDDYIYIREGTYYESILLEVSGVYLFAYGDERVIIDGRSPELSNLLQTVDQGIEYAAAVSILSESRITPAELTDVVDDAIVTVNETDIKLTGIEICNSPGRGITCLDNGYLTLDDVKVYQTAKELVYVEGGSFTAGDSEFYEGCTLNQTPEGEDGYGIDNYLNGIHIDSSGSTGTSIVMTDCHLWNIHGASIYINNSQFDTVEGCWISNSAGPAIRLRNVEDCTIEKNAIFYTTDYPADKRSLGFVLLEERTNNDENESDTVEFESNIVVGCKWGIWHFGGVSQELLERNYDNTLAVNQNTPGSSAWRNVFINRNTFVDQVQGHRLARSSQLNGDADPGSINCYLTNNIFYETRGRILVWEERDIYPYIFDSNMYNKRPDKYSDLTAVVVDDGSQIGDADLSDPTAEIEDHYSFDPLNYALKTSSPAKGTGSTTYPAASDDFFGNLLNTPLPDIGALQVQSDYDTVTVDFTADVVSGDKPLTVEFTGSVEADSNIQSVLWTFGDGGVSTEDDPVHIYNREGHYTVSLTVTDINGVTTKEEKEQYILVDFNNSIGGGIPTRAEHYNIVDVTAAPDVYGMQTVAHGLQTEPTAIILMSGDNQEFGGFSIGAWGDGHFGKVQGSLVIRSRNEGTTKITRGTVWGSNALVTQKEWSLYSTDSKRVLFETIIEVIEVDDTNVTLRFYGSDNIQDLSLICFGGEGVKVGVTTGELASAAGSEARVNGLGEIDSAIILAGSPHGRINQSNTPAIWSMGIADRIQQFVMGYRWDNYGTTPPVDQVGTVFNRTTEVICVRETDTDSFVRAVATFDGNDLVLTSHAGNTAGYSVPYVIISFDCRGLRTSIVQTSMGQVVGLSDAAIGYNAGLVFGLYPSRSTNSIGTNVYSTGNHLWYALTGSISRISRTYNLGGTDDGYSLKDTAQVHLRDASSLLHLADIYLYTKNNIRQNTIIAAGPGTFGYALAFEEGVGTDPVAEFSTNVLIGYEGITEFQIYNEADPNGLSVTYSYNMGDTAIYTSEEPSHVYTAAGNYTITQTVTSGIQVDTFSVDVVVVSAELIPSYRLEYRGRNIKAGSLVTFIDTTEPLSGTTIDSAYWVISLYTEDSALVPVAISEERTFDHLMQHGGNYHIELTITLSDNTIGKAGGFFEAEVLYPPDARVEVSVLGGGEKGVSGVDGTAPTTIRIVDLSSLHGKEVLEQQITVSRWLNNTVETIYSVYNRSQVDYTFDEAGEYFVHVGVTTTDGQDIARYTGYITILDPVEEPIGMHPITVGTSTENKHNSDGDHSHAVEATIEGTPDRIVATDRRGGSAFQNIAIGSTLARVYNSLKERVVGAISGKLLFIGVGSGLAGEDIAVDALSFSPEEGAQVNLGTYHSQWHDANVYNLIASNLVKRGYVSSVDGDIFVGQSHDLVQDVHPRDKHIYIRDGRRILLGDYLVFAREELYEVFQVISSPIEDPADPDKWIVPVKRGDEIDTASTSSHWYIGDAISNIGGGIDANESLVAKSWIEILHGRSLDSRINNSDAEHTPGIVGTYRSKLGPNGIERFFFLGNLAGVYGYPEGTPVPGVVLGEQESGALHMVVAEKQIVVRHGDGRDYLRIDPVQGLTIIIEDSTTPASNYGLQTADGIDAGSFGGYVDPNTGEVVTYLRPSSADVVSIIRIGSGEEGPTFEYRRGGSYGTGEIYIQGLPAVIGSTGELYRDASGYLRTG